MAIAAGAYATLMALSLLVRHLTGIDAQPEPGPSQVVTTIRHEGEAVDIARVEWGDTADPRPPLLLIHGSPGDWTGFARMGPILAADGRRVIAVDLPGFGASSVKAPDVSPRGHGLMLLEMLDALGIQRTHTLGWSMGGAVALRMAEASPDRVATITMLGSVGAQESEGSGSFAFERVRYGLGWAAMVAGVEALPHFGLAGPRWMRQNWIENFLTADLRPMAEIMRRLEVPVLIVHGRHDILSPWHGAVRHHGLMPSNSRLLMLDANHFLPFRQADESAELVGGFIARHDTTGVAAQLGSEWRVPRPAGPLADARDAWIGLPWFVKGAAIALVAAVAPGLAMLGSGLMRAVMWVDFGVAFVAVVIGRAVRDRPAGGRRGALDSAKLVLGTLGRMAIATLVCGSVAVWTFDGLGGGAVGLIAAGVVAAVLFAATPRLFTRSGRRSLRLLPARLASHEWWPSWAIYLPLWYWLTVDAIRYRHPCVFTCANPGIGNAGGFIDESKAAILRGFRGELASAMLPWVLIEAHAADRATAAAEAVRTQPELGGYPIIAKPDRGQKGFGVTRCDDEAALRRAVDSMEVDLMLQRYHPGPAEFAVMWIRSLDERGDGMDRGRVVSVTRKASQHVVGDGTATLRALIARDRRLRMQEHVFAERFGPAGMRRVPGVVERVTLGHAGNHCQGAAFYDAPELITPDLSAAMDRLMLGFSGEHGGGLDVVRLDLRCQSGEQLARGHIEGVLELNGTTAESVSIYDPRTNARWAWGVVAAQWRAACALGAWRQRTGVRPTGPIRLLRMVRRHTRTRRGSAVSS